MSASTEVIEEKKTTRCLVIQMGRLGDSLQSLMALRAAKQLYPFLEIHFICRESLSAAAKKTPWLKGVFTFPTQEIIGPLVKGKKSEKEAIRDIAKWLGPVIETPWDMVVNWTYSEASSFLTSIIPAKIKLGYSRRKDSTFFAADGWSQYIQGIVQGHHPQNIHLTDILTTQLLTALQIHFGDPMPNGDSPVTSKAFFALSPPKRSLKKVLEDPTKKWIGFQLKGVAPEKWAKLAHLILQRHPDWNILLLGTDAETSLNNQVFENLGVDPAIRSKVHSWVGEGDFEQWAYAIGHVHWLFSGDSSALHLASVLGTRILHITKLGSREMGPYGNGHYVIKPKNTSQPVEPQSPSLPEYDSHATAPAEAIYGLWTYACQEWVHRRQTGLSTHMTQLGLDAYVNSIQAYRSSIRNSQEGGGVYYEPLFSQPLEFQDWMAMVLGHIARAWYCGWVPSLGAEVRRETIGPSLVQSVRSIEEGAHVLQEICDKATSTADQLSRKGSSLKSEKVMGLEDRSTIQTLGATLAELESLMKRVTNARPQLLPFSEMSKVLMHNLRGEQISELARETGLSYKRIHDGLTILREWISHTLGLVKPTAVMTPSSKPRKQEKETHL